MSEDWSAEKMEKLQKILKKMREDPLKYKRVHNAIIEAATMTPQEWNAAEEQAEREQQAKLEPRAEQQRPFVAPSPSSYSSPGYDSAGMRGDAARITGSTPQGRWAAEQEARMIKSKTEAILRGDDVQG
ncbi:MAG: hypothetical protein JWQ95_6019 [Sphaerisporangium sp.]|nr:hypothetical protein [Sphaerisporangium sp.]